MKTPVSVFAHWILLLGLLFWQSSSEARSPRQSDGSQNDQHDLAQVLERFDVHPELEISLFAAEPMLVNPTNIDIDHLGRVWVCEVVNYRRFANPNGPKRDEGDRILILKDTNQDGVADDQTVFYQGPDIDSAHGICVLGDRALVSAGDSVFFLIDTDGDSKADKKELLFTGIRGTQHDHGIHAFVFGPDGKLYFNFGNAGGQILDKDGQPIIDVSGKTVRADRSPYQEGMIFRCNVDGTQFETLAWNFRNNWEVCVDSFGRIWQSDNDDDGNRGVRINFVLEHGNYGYRDSIDGSGWRDARTGMHPKIPLRHWHQNDPGVVPNLLQTGAGSPTGICFYEGPMLPTVFQNQMIHCDAGPNIVRAYPIKRSGSGYSAETVNMMNGIKHNKWFRPSDVCVAPDGSILVSDWYDPGVGGHRMGDVQRGRLFRITPKNLGSTFHVQPVDVSTAESAAHALTNPNLATRFLAWSSLQKMGPKSEAALATLFRHENPMFRARALWLLTKIGLDQTTTDKYLMAALGDPSAELAATAVRCIRQLSDRNQILRLLRGINLEKQSTPVRREFLISLSDRNLHDLDELRNETWAKLASFYNGGDRWYLESLGIAAENDWDKLLGTLTSGKPTEFSKFFNTQPAQDIAWRSRGVRTPELLANIIAKPATDEHQILRYLRSMDFVSDSQEKQHQLMRLAFGALITDAKKFNVAFPELLTRIQSTTFSESQNAIIGTFLDDNKNTPQFVQLVHKLRFEDRYPQLVDIAIESNNNQLRVDSIIALLKNGSMQTISKRMMTEPDDRFEQLCVSARLTQHPKVVKLLADYIRTKSNRLNRRKIAVSAMGGIRSGANTILGWAEKNEFDLALEAAIAATLHSAPWSEISNRANKLFPVAAGKDNVPVPKISDLIKKQGNVINGLKLFVGTGTCAKCHVIKGQGIEVGPDLSEIGSKLSRTAMYEALLFPSAGISHSYENWLVLTDDGSLHQGILVSETDSQIQIKDKDGIVHKVPLDEIEEKKQLQLSMMPEDLHKDMTTQDIVDLIEFMVTLKKK